MINHIIVLRCGCPHTRPEGEHAMQDIMIRIQTDDFEAWKEQH